MARVFLQAGALVNIPTVEIARYTRAYHQHDHDHLEVQTPALFAACEKGCIDTVEFLLEAHANVNQPKRIQDQDLRNGTDVLLASPLCVACENGFADVVMALIEARASLTEMKVHHHRGFIYS